MESILEISKALIILVAILGGSLLVGCICGNAVEKGFEALPESTAKKLEELWSAIFTIGLILAVILGIWFKITSDDPPSYNEFDDYPDYDEPQGPYYRGQEY